MKKSFVISLFSTALIFSMGALVMTYFTKTGKTPESIERWPPQLSYLRSETMPSIVLFAHPKCSCTEATVSELDRILREVHRPYSLKVVLRTYQREDWRNTSIVSQILKLPGVEVIEDPDGGITKSSGSSTSGEAFLMDANGRVIFRGGLTSGRAHPGRTPASVFIVKWMQSDQKNHKSLFSSIFGCDL